jgi:hypothetical protein
VHDVARLRRFRLRLELLAGAIALHQLANRSSGEDRRRVSDPPLDLAPEVCRAIIGGGTSINTLTRWLEQNEARTALGKALWAVVQVKGMLRSRTYTGNRYYRATNVSDAVIPKHERKADCENTETICIKAPAIISQELFDRVQARFLQNVRRYTQPPARHLLNNMIECGECGCKFRSYRRYTTARQSRCAPRISRGLVATPLCNGRRRTYQKTVTASGPSLYARTKVCSKSWRLPLAVFDEVKALAGMPDGEVVHPTA